MEAKKSSSCGVTDRDDLREGTPELNFRPAPGTRTRPSPGPDSPRAAICMRELPSRTLPSPGDRLTSRGDLYEGAPKAHPAQPRDAQLRLRALRRHQPLRPAAPCKSARNGLGHAVCVKRCVTVFGV